MPRPVWTGTISFGLVSVPIKLYTAVRDRSVRFHQLDEETGARVRYRRVSERTGEEIPKERITRGYDLGDGRHVTLSEEELQAAAPEATRAIDIEDFVDLASIDPVYFDTTYYLGPADRTGERAYALLHEAMRRTGRAAVGRFVLRSKERLVALRPLDGILAMETMHFHDEVADPAFVEPPDTSGVDDRELEVARQLIDALTTDWKPENYVDQYRERVLEAVERKTRGEEIVAAAEEPEPAAVVDLVSALRESVERSRRRAPAAEAAGGGQGASERNGHGNGDARRARGRAEGTDDLEDRTLQDLYHEAREAGIRGRSGMSKEQLIDALREARGRKSA